MASRHQSTPPSDRHTPRPLQRRLGVVDSTAIGLGSMLGSGVFVVFAPAEWPGFIAGWGFVTGRLLPAWRWP